MLQCWPVLVWQSQCLPLKHFTPLTHQADGRPLANDRPSVSACSTCWRPFGCLSVLSWGWSPSVREITLIGGSAKPRQCVCDGRGATAHELHTSAPCLRPLAHPTDMVCTHTHTNTHTTDYNWILPQVGAEHQLPHQKSSTEDVLSAAAEEVQPAKDNDGPLLHLHHRVHPPLPLIFFLGTCECSLSQCQHSGRRPNNLQTRTENERK